MINKLFKIAALFAILLCASSFAYSEANGSQGSSQPVLKLGHNDSLGMPLRWIEEGQYVGPMIEIMHQLSERSGIKFEFVPQPFARTWEMIKSGRAIDGAFGNYYTPERAKLAHYFHPPIGYYYNRLYVSTDVEKPPATMAELEGNSVITLINHSISKEFDTYLEQNKIRRIGVTSYASMMEMLRLKRARYAAAPQHAFDTIIQEQGYNKDVVKAPLLFAERPLYFYLSKQANTPNKQKLMETLTQTMNDMEKDKVFEQAHKKFGTKYRRID